MILFLDASKCRYDIRPGRPRRMTARVSMRACRKVWPRLFWFSTLNILRPMIHLWSAHSPVESVKTGVARDRNTTAHRIQRERDPAVFRRNRLGSTFDAVVWLRGVNNASLVSCVNFRHVRCRSRPHGVSGRSISTSLQGAAKCAGLDGVVSRRECRCQLRQC